MKTKRKSTKEACTLDDQDNELEERHGSKNILVCNSKGTFGIVCRRAYVELYERAYYTEDTVINHKGQDIAHKAGTYGPWHYSAKPYPAKWDQALKYIVDWIAQDNLAEAGDFNYIIEVLDQTKNDVINSVTASIDLYLKEQKLAQ